MELYISGRISIRKLWPTLQCRVELSRGNVAFLSKLGFSTIFLSGCFHLFILFMSWYQTGYLHPLLCFKVGLVDQLVLIGNLEGRNGEEFAARLPNHPSSRYYLVLTKPMCKLNFLSKVTSTYLPSLFLGF